MAMLNFFGPAITISPPLFFLIKLHTLNFLRGGKIIIIFLGPDPPLKKISVRLGTTIYSLTYCTSIKIYGPALLWGRVLRNSD